MSKPENAINLIRVSAYTIPTLTPESDGTIEWDKTTLVLVRIDAAGETGLGYSYADPSAAHLIHELLAPKIQHTDAMCNGHTWKIMTCAVRNAGRPGIASSAIAAVDNALWDLKGKLLKISVAALLGGSRREVLAYGSGGFTSYSDEQLTTQLGGWAQDGLKAVKMKVGRNAAEDPHRVKLARKAIGDHVALFVDANGAYSRKQALEQAHIFAESQVTWFEEPVSSDDLEGLRLIRDRAPAGMDIAAGEYGYDTWYFRHMLDAGAVDVLQADATRCAGITGFMQADALCQSRSMPLSAHTSPSIHGHVCCGAQNAINVEYFFDHERIEGMAFEGALRAENGMLRPDFSRAGLGLTFKETDMQPYCVFDSQQKNGRAHSPLASKPITAKS